MGILGRLKSGSFNESKFENGKQSIKQPRVRAYRTHPTRWF